MGLIILLAKHMSQKGFINLIVIGIVFAFVLGVGGYFILVKKLEPVTPPPSTTNNVLPDTPSASETANWKTYINTKDGWQISFPTDYITLKPELDKRTDMQIIVEPIDKFKIYSKEWAHTEDPSSGVVFSIARSEKPADMSVAEWVKKQIEADPAHYLDVSPEIVQINGKEFVKIRSTIPGGCTIGEVYLSEIYLKETKTTGLLHIILEKCLPETTSRNKEIMQILGTFRLES